MLSAVISRDAVKEALFPVHELIGFVVLLLDRAMRIAPGNSHGTVDAVFRHPLLNGVNGGSKYGFIQLVIDHHKFIAAGAVCFSFENAAQMIRGMAQQNVASAVPEPVVYVF